MDEQNLINTVNEIATIIENSNKIAEENKENFNVLECLTRFHLEELHSRFLGYLLDPKASHDCGGEFLKEFLSQINFPGIKDIEAKDINNGNVVLEKNIGRKEEGEEFYGFIDIYIELGEHIIVIENKLTAKDQKDQLLRYNNYCEKIHGNKKTTIYYLTLWGTASPDAEGLNSESKIDYEKISYRYTILSWLESCINKISINYPSKNAMSGIDSYLNLLKRRILHIPTNTTMEKIEKLLELQDISKVLANVDSIAEALRVTRNQILKNFWEEVLTSVQAKLNSDWKIEFMTEEKVDDRHGHLGLFHVKREYLHVAFENLYYKQGNRLDNCILALWKDPRIKVDVGEHINSESGFLLNNESWIIHSEEYGSILIENDKIYQNPNNELAQKLADAMLKFASDHFNDFNAHV